MIFRRFFYFLRPTVGHGNLEQPQSLEYISFFFYVYCFSPTSGILRKLKFYLPSYFGITRRIIKKIFLIFYKKKLIFTASDRLQKPGPTLVFGIFIPSTYFYEKYFVYKSTSKQALGLQSTEFNRLISDEQSTTFQAFSSTIYN